MLEPDRDQLEIFADALLRYAGSDGFVSVRAFFEDDAGAPFRVTPTSLKGGVRFLLDVVEDDARRAAQCPKPVVFCPPLCLFGNKDRARKEDISTALVLSIECDQHPQQARQKLEALFGPATVVVKSGGVWSKGDDEAEDKLHLHWRLARPARGSDINKLEQARILAARLVGGDPSNTPINHPIRWPGSWHRKAEPRLCAIETVNADTELELNVALELLIKAAPESADTTVENTYTGHDRRRRRLVGPDRRYRLRQKLSPALGIDRRAPDRQQHPRRHHRETVARDHGGVHRTARSALAFPL